MRRVLLTTLLCGFLAGCNGYSDLAQPPHIQSVWHSAWPDADVFYVTDRGERHDSPRMGGRGENWAGPTCGRLRVNMPSAGAVQTVDKHAMDWAVIRQEGDAAEKDKTEYVVPDCNPPDPDQPGDSPLQQFVKRMVAESKPDVSSCVLLYVHGYNNTFDTAIIRTAQMMTDTQRRCIPLAFSWSSAGQIDRYVSDAEHSSYAVPLLRALLLALKHEGLRIDVVAHSMGTRLTLQTLVTMQRYCGAAPLISQLILAAPDIGEEQDNDDFSQLLTDDQDCARRTTIYASANDSVLTASQSIHGGIVRAGRDPQTTYERHQTPYPEGAPAPAHPIDVIDAGYAPGDQLGHGYYAMSYENVRDIALVLADVPSAERTGVFDGYPPTLACGAQADQACVGDKPQYKLIVAANRRWRPSWLMRTLRDLIPLNPAG